MKTFKQKIDDYDKMIFDAIFEGGIHPWYSHDKVKKIIKKIINQAKREAKNEKRK